MELFDTHCHLDFRAFDVDRDEVMARAHAAGVQSIVVPGFEPAQWEALAELSRRYDGVKIAVGLHPEASGRPGAAARLREELAASAKSTHAVAIGECGLDRRVSASGGPSLEQQRALLLHHLVVARELELPVILHAVRASGAMLDTLRSVGTFARGGVIHGFTGPRELVLEYARLGLSFGVGGAITRPNARRAREAARAIPADRLLIETDAPDMPPFGSGLARNEPAFLRSILRVLAEIREESEERLARQTLENGLALFGEDDRRTRAVC